MRPITLPAAASPVNVACAQASAPGVEQQQQQPQQQQPPPIATVPPAVGHLRRACATCGVRSVRVARAGEADSGAARAVCISCRCVFISESSSPGAQKLRHHLESRVVCCPSRSHRQQQCEAVVSVSAAASPSAAVFDRTMSQLRHVHSRAEWVTVSAQLDDLPAWGGGGSENCLPLRLGMGLAWSKVLHPRVAARSAIPLELDVALIKRVHCLVSRTRLACETLSEHYAWRRIEEKLASAEERRALCARNAGWRTRRRGASDYRPTVG